MSSEIVRRQVQLELRGVAGVDGDTEKIGREPVEGDRNCLRAGAGDGVVIDYSLQP